MDSSKLKIFIIIAVILLVLLVGIFFLVFREDPSPTASYPESVQQAINNPVERNGSWSTLASGDEYQISYSTSQEGDSFFITVFGTPVLTAAEKAEQALLSKLAITKEEACQLPVVINVTASADPNLSGYNFGLSFCSNRPHIRDVPQQTAPDSGTKDPGA